MGGVSAPVIRPEEAPGVEQPPFPGGPEGRKDVGGRPILRQYQLVDKVRQYDPDVDEDLLDRAYVFAMMAHGSQVRESGDPYFHHPVEVAGILADYRLDAETIAAALLHDVVEDTPHTLGEIEKLFGPTVARLVDGVTKLGRIPTASVRARQAENFRKLVLAMSDDIRVLLVKLADRLHNMRTLHYVRDPERRRRIALETLEIYAPLAARIGMGEIKEELEDLAFRELNPEAHARISAHLEELKRRDPGLVERIAEELRRLLAEHGLEAEVKGRQKRPYSIWRKMQRKNVALDQISDIVAFRIIVDTVQQCYTALGVVHATYHVVPGRFKDYISTPKSNGYRSIHTTVLGPENQRIEIQIRTRAMDEEAERGVAAHWSYKEGQPNTEGRSYPWVQDLLEILENATSAEDFLEHTRLDLHRDQVFCFTPKGDIVTLPRGATPVDFAYAIHSEVGDHCWAAKVDGRIVPLDHRLENGSVVEILTRRDACPSPEWERFVVSGKARARIRRFLRTRQRDFFIERGRELLSRTFAVRGQELSDRALETARRALDYRSVEDLLAAVGEGLVSARFVLEAVHPELRERRPESERDPRVIPLTTPTRREDKTPTDGAIVGLPPWVPYQFARCCGPVPGEDIVGVIRTGRPVSIHRRDCRLLARIQDLDRRRVELGWSDREDGVRAPVRIRVLAVNRPGALGEISSAIGREGANITDVRFGRKTVEIYEIFLDCDVAGVDHLERMLANLRTLDCVTFAERSRG